MFFLNQHRNTFVLFIIILLNGCLSNQMLPNELSDYRATIISSRLPQKIGALTLVQAKSDTNNISLIFTKSKFVDMDSLVEQVAIDFCDEDETRYLLERGISYRIITLDSNNKVDSLNFISLNTCINDE
ncbi:type II secretion system pilot lipoprotein GspS-beta [Vibrio parahaemolyticus]|uniref:type II secretion system pilot lipoprotein GspS-beta n=1 Tax=Vibrio parahaemolyticus TaxID=670 RepID=UPI00358F4307